MKNRSKFLIVCILLGVIDQGKAISTHLKQPSVTNLLDTTALAIDEKKDETPEDKQVEGD
jgi:hypothetical protein